MESSVDFAEPRRIDMCVYLRRADVGMSQHFLNRPYVGAMLKHVRSKTVAQNVGGYARARDACGFCAFQNDFEYTLSRKWAAEPCQKNLFNRQISFCIKRPGCGHVPLERATTHLRSES